MLLPPLKPAKSTTRKLLDLVCSVQDRVRSMFIAPRRARRSAANVYLCHHSVAAVEALEPRLCLTPVAVADSYYGNLNGTTNIPAAEGLLANDSGTNLTAVLVSQPYYGTVSLSANGSFIYTNTKWTLAH